MHFGFALDLSDIDLLNVDLLDQRYTHLDLFEDVFKTFCEMSSRRFQRRKIVTLKTCWRRLQDMSWRRLEDQQMFAGITPISVSWEIVYEKSYGNYRIRYVKKRLRHICLYSRKVGNQQNLSLFMQKWWFRKFYVFILLCLNKLTV